MTRSNALLVLLGACLCFLPAAFASAQPGGGIRFSDRIGGVSRLLRSEEVQQEIELVGDQQAELRAMADDLRQEMRGRTRELFAGMRDLSREERRERMRDVRAEMREIQSEIEGRVSEVLLPHQMDRLRQIELQQQLRTRGTASLLRGRVAEGLGITPEQQEQMREKAAAAQADLQAKIEKLRREAREEVLTVLTADQRAKLDSMLGAEFNLPSRRLRDGRRRPQERGPAGLPELE